jgi:hypothetical protein
MRPRAFDPCRTGKRSARDQFVERSAARICDAYYLNLSVIQLCQLREAESLLILNMLKDV